MHPPAIVFRRMGIISSVRYNLALSQLKEKICNLSKQRIVKVMNIYTGRTLLLTLFA